MAFEDDVATRTSPQAHLLPGGLRPLRHRRDRFHDLAESAFDQRVVEREANRPRLQPPHHPAIARHLVAIALRFAVEERFGATALVRAGLEVDDPTLAVRD